jgi:hypothetical protein
MADFYTNLPGVQPSLEDGNLDIPVTSSAPIVLVLGTAASGTNDQPTPVSALSDAKATFGSDGTLLRGIYEVRGQGETNIRGMRIGGTVASLEGIGVDTATGGYILETSEKDDEAGDRYSIYFDVASGRLAVFDTTAEEWELDTDGELAPLLGNGGVTLSGSITSSAGTDIGSLSSPVLMSAVTGLTPGGGDAGWTYTAGTDGISASRMELYEYLYDAYEMLDFVDIDIVVPMDVYIDDLNVADLTSGEITALGLDTLTDYPTANADDDALGKVFVQEKDGQNYFWWDTDNDGIAEIYPSVGSASATTDADGSTLTASDFHEVNFAYQLAEFCHRSNKQWHFTIGMIPFKMPQGFSLKAISQWIGTLPNYTTNAATLERDILASADNGTGILGNKFLAGRNDYRGGVADGGLIETEGSRPTGSWMDGVEVEDTNDHVVDIGKYLSVLGGLVVHTNNFAGVGYIAPINAAYAGMVSQLAPQSAPTNKVMKKVRLVRNIKGAKLDQLAGVRCVSLVQKSKGVVVTDAPTAARPDSDYQRLSTVRIVKKIVQDIRQVSDPFIGEPNSPSQQSALQTAIETKIQEQTAPGGGLLRFDLAISSTPSQRIAGQAIVDLVLVPAGELRQIPLTISLAPE